MDDRKSETAIIEEAYEERLKLLFGVLCDNLTGVAVLASDMSEAKAVEYFCTGLQVTRQSRRLALAACGP